MNENLRIRLQELILAILTLICLASLMWKTYQPAFSTQSQASENHDPPQINIVHSDGTWTKIDCMTTGSGVATCDQKHLRITFIVPDPD